MAAPAPLAAFPPSRDACPTLPAPLLQRGYGLRPLVAGDLSWLRELYASTRAEELAPVPWPEAAKRLFLESQFALQHQHYLAHFGDSHFLAIERDGAAVGRYYLQRNPSHDLIVDISLFPAERGCGVASALIAHSQHEAGLRGSGMELHVDGANPAALRLYQRLGFVGVEQQGTHLLMRWQRACAQQTGKIS